MFGAILYYLYMGGNQMKKIHEAATIYFHGNAAVYTGKSETLYRQTCYEIRLTEGHLKGQTKWTYRTPKE